MRPSFAQEDDNLIAFNAAANHSVDQPQTNSGTSKGGKQCSAQFCSSEASWWLGTKGELDPS